MPEPLIIPGDLFYLFLVPLIPTIFMAITIFWKRSETSGSKSVIADMSINAISKDLTEVKIDVKEQRKEIQTLADDIHQMNAIKDRLKNLETALDQNIRSNNPRFEDALRQIDVLNVRVANLEEKVNSNTSHIERLKRGDQ
jgi:predicted RNase H-like nuclease (RuvC/YqgF family)